MGKVSPDAMLDSSLTYVSGGDTLCICTTEPTTEAEAYTTNMLARIAITSGSFAITSSSAAGGGRQLTIAEQTDIPISNAGNAEHVAIVKHSDNTIRYITTCTLQALVVGGTVDVPAWVITLSDPT